MKKKNEVSPSFTKMSLTEPKMPRLLLANWKTIKGGTKTKFLSEQIDSLLYK